MEAVLRPWPPARSERIAWRLQRHPFRRPAVPEFLLSARSCDANADADAARARCESSKDQQV